jgi:hypothetical protein
MSEGRGLPIGDYKSQTFGNLSSCRVDRYMKEVVRCKGYVRYCDDVVGMAHTAEEARHQLEEYIRISEKYGHVVKAGFTISKIARVEKRKKRRRWRQRGRKRQTD